MRFLRRKHDDDERRADIETPEPECEHVTLIPRWDDARDVGHADRASMYHCEACGAEFTPDEAVGLRETEAARIQRRLAG